MWPLFGSAADLGGATPTAAPRARFWASDFSVAHLLSLSHGALSAIAYGAAPIAQATMGIDVQRPPRIYVELAVGTLSQRGNGLVMNAGGFTSRSRDFVTPETLDLTGLDDVTLWRGRAQQRPLERSITVRLRDSRDASGVALVELADATPVVVLLNIEMISGVEM